MKLYWILGEINFSIQSNSVHRAQESVHGEHNFTLATNKRQHSSMLQLQCQTSGNVCITDSGKQL